MQAFSFWDAMKGDDTDFAMAIQNSYQVFFLLVICDTHTISVE